MEEGKLRNSRNKKLLCLLLTAAMLVQPMAVSASVPSGDPAADQTAIQRQETPAAETDIQTGEDVTAQYEKGARETLHMAQLYHCPAAILKERSPSCGSGQIYDGTHTRTLIPGDGVTTELLRKHGIAVFGESETDKLEKLIDDMERM